MANGMLGIMEAMQKKNGMLGQMSNGQAPAPAAQPAASPATNMAEVQRIATDNNANATPQKNAVDIDIIALKLMEFDAIFAVMLPAIDKFKAEHDELMQALAAIRQPPMPPAGV